MSSDDVGRSGRSKEFRDQDGRTLPERMRQRRTARHLRSYEMARALGVSPSYVTMIERGKKVPSEDVAVAIAKLLGDDPELYRAWVHSTRFTDPTSTLRGLRQLYYSGPRPRPVPGASIQSASQRARRRRDNLSSPGEVEELVAEDMKFCMSARIPELQVGLVGDNQAQTAPLIAIGRTVGKQVRFWRLPWALLDNDSRPRRFVIATTPEADTLLVATPEQFVNVVMMSSGSDLMDSGDWRGWDDQSPEGSGGLHAQRFQRRGKFAPLLRDKNRFLEMLGQSVDVIVREGAGVSIRRLTLRELEAQLEEPT